MDQKKVAELLKKEDFVKKIASLQTVKELQAAFKAEGVDISLDEIKALVESSSGKELSDDALENVAGGVDQQFIDKLNDQLIPEIFRRRKF